MSILVTLCVVAVVFLAALTRTTFGFGDAVVGMPLLAFLPIPLNTAVSLMGLVGLTMALLAVMTGWRRVDRTALAPLLIAALLGIPFGLLMVRLVSQSAITGLLGVLLIFYGLGSVVQRFILVQRSRRRQLHPGWGYVFGFVSGVLGSAYNFHGMPVAVYGTLRGWLPAQFRNTMQAYFLVSGLLIVIGQAASGLWSSELLPLYLVSLLSIATAVGVGTILHRRISPDKFQSVLFVFITAIGVLLLVKSVV